MWHGQCLQDMKKDVVKGVGSIFGIIRFRTTDISEFRILKERRSVIRFFFNFRIYFVFLYLLKLFEHLKYIIIYKIGNL